MSGICAFWRKDGAAAGAEPLQRVCRLLSQEQPEPVHIESDGPAVLGVAAGFESQQSYCGENVMAVCDAELYNERELWQAAGAKPRAGANATAALLCGLYECMGPLFIEKLRGPFSLILWDRRARQMLAAIDGFAIRQLAYYESPQMIAFATRCDALVRGGVAPAEINPRAIPRVLNFSTNLGPETIFEHVCRLPAGNLLVAKDGGLRLTQYWDMRYAAGRRSDEHQLSRELDSVVEQSVALHCKQDPPRELGAFLSGGTDSSTVVGMMRRRFPREPVNAFSIGFQDEEFNELGYADIAARRFRADHRKYLVSADDCYEAMPRIIRSFDEPFGNSSAVATYFCARLAAEHGVKVLLAGDGGDELFGGNEWYLTDRIFEAYQIVPRLLRAAVIEPGLRLLPFERGPIGRAKRYVRRASMPPVERVCSFQFLYTHAAADVFECDFLYSLRNYSLGEVPSGHYARAAAFDHLNRVLYMDMKIVLADSDLPKVTKMTELAGVRARFPFLDRAVAEFAGRIPARLKVKGTQKRYLFKRAFRDLLPPEIIAKKKHGFGIPVAGWLRSDRRMHELMQDTLLSSRAQQRGYFRRGFVEDLVRKHDAEYSTYYGDTLWTFLMLELWHRQFVDEAVGAVL